MTEHVIAKKDELGEGDRMVVQVKGREIGIFHVDGEYFAYTNWCVHQGGPCTEGSLTGTMKASYDSENLEVNLEWSDDENILNCPWHGWEYEVKTGKCLSKSKVVLPSHEVKIKDEHIVLDI